MTKNNLENRKSVLTMSIHNKWFNLCTGVRFEHCLHIFILSANKISLHSTPKALILKPPIQSTKVKATPPPPPPQPYPPPPAWTIRGVDETGYWRGNRIHIVWGHADNPDVYRKWLKADQVVSEIPEKLKPSISENTYWCFSNLFF